MLNSGKSCDDARRWPLADDETPHLVRWSYPRLSSDGDRLGKITQCRTFLSLFLLRWGSSCCASLPACEDRKCWRRQERYRRCTDVLSLVQISVGGGSDNCDTSAICSTTKSHQNVSQSKWDTECPFWSTAWSQDVVAKPCPEDHIVRTPKASQVKWGFLVKHLLSQSISLQWTCLVGGLPCQWYSSILVPEVGV